MDIKDFIMNFADQFEEIDHSKLNSETVFRDIEGWSSIDGLAVIAMVDEQYNVKMKGEDIHKSKTINDLFEIVKERI